MRSLSLFPLSKQLNNYIRSFEANRRLVHEQRPHRNMLSFWVNNHHYIVTAAVSLILLIGTGPYLRDWVLIALIPYWLYVFLYNRLGLHLQGNIGLHLNYGSSHLQVARSILVSGGAFLFLLYVYTQTNYPVGSSNLWLLFVLTTFIASQHTKSIHAVIITLFCCGLIVLLNFFAYPQLNADYWRDTLTSLGWIGLLSYITHVLLRSLNDGFANAQLLNRVSKKLVELGEIRSHYKLGLEHDVLNAAASQISEDFIYPHVNIFFKEGDKAICVAGASEGGKLLAKTNFDMSISQGIVGYVMRTGKPHLANDVNRERLFFYHDAFPDTKAELVVPMKIDGKVIGVIDIQADARGFFLPFDIQVIETLGYHLAVVLDNLRLSNETRKALDINERIEKMMRSSTKRFLASLEMFPKLRAVAETAQKELDADVVVLYERDPDTKQITGPVVAGELLQQERLRGSPEARNNIIHTIFAGEETVYFHSDIDMRTDPLEVAKSLNDPQRNLETRFVFREKIQSRAIWVLEQHGERIGLIFLNFREKRVFDSQEKQFFYSFMDLASLAISQAQVYEDRIRQHHELLTASLHDQLKNGAKGTGLMITNAIKDFRQGQLVHNDLLLIDEAINALLRDINFLEGTFKDTFVSEMDLCDEINRLAERATQTYGVVVRISWEGEKLIPPSMGYYLKMIITEGVYNALIHSKAQQIDVAVETDNRSICILIEDNGRGFDPELIRPGGIRNMRMRTEEQLGGYCQVDTEIGKGTKVFIMIPFKSGASMQCNEEKMNKNYSRLLPLCC